MSRYRFIEVEKVNHAITILCRVLKVSRSAYYHWTSCPLSARAQANLTMTARISDIHSRSRQTYGSPRVHAELRTSGHRCSENRVARLMRAASIVGRYPRRFRRTTVSDPWTEIPDLLHRDFIPQQPDQTWVADMVRHEAP